MTRSKEELLEFSAQDIEQALQLEMRSKENVYARLLEEQDNLCHDAVKLLWDGKLTAGRLQALNNRHNEVAYCLDDIYDRLELLYDHFGTDPDNRRTVK